MAIVQFRQTQNTEFFYLSRVGYRQKPFVKAMELGYNVIRSVKVAGSSSGGYPILTAGSQMAGSAYGDFYNTLTQGWGSSSIPRWVYDTYNRLYAKLIKYIGEKAATLTALAETRSTFSMVVNRLEYFYKGAALLLNKRDLQGFLRYWGLKPKRKHRNIRWAKRRKLSSYWLEYWMGWAPTISDIMSALEVLSRPYGDQRIRVVTGQSKQIVKKSGGVTSYHSTVDMMLFLQLRCVISPADVTSGLIRAEQLGLLNLPKTAWELTPWSWFIDWFTNIGQVLGSVTDMAGWSISDAWMTRYAYGSETFVASRPNSDYGGHLVRNFDGMQRHRVGAIPRPTLMLKTLDGLSPTRGATLASLIVQLFSGSR